MKNETDKKLQRLSDYCGDVEKRLNDMVDRKHGGARPNSGPQKTKGKHVSMRLAQDVQDTLEEVVKGERANNKTEAVEEAVRGHWKDSK